MSASHVEFDVRGIVGVRLVGPAPADADAVQRTLGLPAGRLSGEPDVVVRFVDRLPTPALRYVEVQRSGFTAEGYVVLWHGRRPVRVLVPFDRLGSRCEFVCERNVGAVPFLLSAIKLAALRRGYVPFHGSAFVHDDAGVLVAGWAHGGKTSALLAFAPHGAAFVADDLVLLRADGAEMLGLPTPLSLSESQVAQLPAARRAVPLARRLGWRALRALERLGRADGPDAAGGRRVRLAGHLLPALRRRSAVHLPPGALFDHVVAGAAVPRVLFLMMSHADSDVRAEPMDTDTACRRILASLRYEELDLHGHYLAYRYAFPERENPFLEQAHELEADLLRRAMAGLSVVLVRHPYPAPLPELHRAMRAFVGHEHAARPGAAREGSDTFRPGHGRWNPSPGEVPIVVARLASPDQAHPGGTRR